MKPSNIIHFNPCSSVAGYLLHDSRKLIYIFLSAVFLFSASEAPAAENQEKIYFGVINFDGSVLTDSLEYSAEIIEYLYDEHKIILTGNAQVNYLGHSLKSGKITYYQDFAYMEAEGIPDSSGVLKDTPVFKDAGSEEMKGDVIKYDLKTREGLIKRGRTKYETGFMAADKIKRASDDTLYVADGFYTTCDIKNHPHYYFFGKKMKFILNDKLIIKPIVAYVHDVPVFWFPFYVFPIKKGRQSGFLTPRYGSSRRDGRYLSNMGYYFATSDYTDYKAAGTIREKNGWLVKNWINYNRRDTIRGSMFGSYENRTEKSGGSKQWKMRLSHSQTVSPTLSITGSGSFESSTYSQYNSTNLYERMNRDMRSTLSITKRWKESGNSLITTFRHQKNLDTDAIQSSLPNISFRKRNKLLFDSPSSKKTRRKYEKDAVEDEEEKEKWYNTIYYGLNAQFKNSNTERTNLNYYDRNMGLSTNLSSSNKFMGWLVAEPSLRLNENFVASNRENNAEHYSRKDNISTGLSLSTTVYGMFKPSIGSIVALRHVVNPSISYSYGKRRSLIGDSAETFFRFDKNDEKKGRVKSMRMNLRNIFQAKTIKEDKERKIDLFNIDFSSSVDFEKENRKISPLRTTVNIKPLKTISTRLTASHDFYHNDDSFHLLSPYLNSMSVTTSVGISKGDIGFIGKSSRENANVNLGRDDFDIGTQRMEGEDGESTESVSGKFNLRFSHSYGITRRRVNEGNDKYAITHYFKPTLSFSLTRNFSVNYYCNYDIEEKDIVSQRVIISRDLHCWQANISWIPSGIREGFYFKVDIKDLPDVKIEKRRGASRISY